MGKIKLWHIIAILVIAIVVWLAKEDDRAQRIQPNAFMPLPSSPPSAFTPLPDHVLASMSAELGEHLNHELPELKVTKVVIMTKTNKRTGWVNIVANVYHKQDGIEIPLVSIGNNKDFPNAKEAFQNLKKSVTQHLKNNTFL